MKKFISLLLVCLMVVPFGMLATTGVSAAGEIYLSDAGDDANAGTDSAPVKTMGKAYELVGTAGGTIVIKGTYTQDAIFTAPAHTGKVTIKGADANAKYSNGSAQRFYLGGDTEFCNLTIDASTAVWMLVCGYNDLTIGEGVVNTGAKTTYIIAGMPSGADMKHTISDVTVTLKSGSWGELIGLLRIGIKYDNGEGGGDIDVVNFFKNTDVVFNIDGAEVGKIAAFSRQVKGPWVAADTTCTVNLNKGSIGYWVGMSDSQATATPEDAKHGYAQLTINISKDFDLAGSFTKGGADATTHIDATGVFNGISGGSVWAKPDTEYAGANAEIVLAAEIYDAQKDNTFLRGAKIVKGNTGDQGNQGNQGNTGNQGNQGNQGNTGNQGNDNADTGDMTWVVAAVATVAVMGCAVVVAKKRA